MPPMLVQTGQDEMLLSDSTTIIDKSKDNNGDAKLITYPECSILLHLNTMATRISPSLE